MSPPPIIETQPTHRQHSVLFIAIIGLAIRYLVRSEPLPVREKRGKFATWRAARAVGDHHLNTFPAPRRSDRARDNLITARNEPLVPIGVTQRTAVMRGPQPALWE
jgi:hypothetical protein